MASTESYGFDRRYGECRAAYAPAVAETEAAIEAGYRKNIAAIDAAIDECGGNRDRSRLNALIDAAQAEAEATYVAANTKLAAAIRAAVRSHFG